MQTPTPPDPREYPPTRVGSALRDAAVDPRPDDYLPPVNAGEPGEAGNPHGPNVVAPGVHASGEYAVVPGPVSEAKEADMADRTRAGSVELVPEVSADLATEPGD